MSYQVIARKWRPQTFEEVTGQEPITRTLRGAIEHDRLHHAYLFSGARGVGKTTTARLLAKALNCHKSEGPTPTPCKSTDKDACASCQEVTEGRSIDVLEIDAASNTGVDNVRDTIINTVGVRPARDRYKVFIIDEVHMLSGAAFNALLKTLEEPPPRVVFIMATTESHKIPDTILSRSQQFEFRTIATQKIAERLRLIADAEKIKVKDEALREIARAGEGSMRDAQSAFDQVISFSEGEITSADVETALGIAGAELRGRVMRAVSAADPREAVAVVDDLVMRGHDLRNFCRDMMAHVRDLLVTKVAGGAEELTGAGEAERRELARSAGDFSESDLVRFFHSLTETEQKLRDGAHPRYQLEIGLVKLIEMRRLAPLGQILERLNALEAALRDGKAATPAAASPAPTGGTGGATPARGRGGSPPPTSSSRFSNARAEGPEPHGPDRPNGVAPGQNFSTKNGGPSVLVGDAKFESQAEGRAQSQAGAGASDDTPPWESPRQPTPTTLKLVEPPQISDGGGVQSASAVAASRAVEDARLASPAGAGVTLVERLKSGLEDRSKPFLAAALEGASRVELVGDELCVEFTPDKKFMRDNLSKPENQKLLREVCAAVVGRAVGLHVSLGGGSDGAQGAAEAADEGERRERQRLREMAEGHPAVQELLRTFRGEIVNVRRAEEKGSLESPSLESGV